MRFQVLSKKVRSQQLDHANHLFQTVGLTTKKHGLQTCCGDQEERRVFRTPDVRTAACLWRWNVFYDKQSVGRGTGGPLMTDRIL